MFKIHQIYYNEASQNALSPEFIPLDNSDNLRPDWAEYWPIRQYLLSQTLDENTYYGFLSAKFSVKTGLHAQQCVDFVQKNQSESTDAIVFSPLWGFSSFFKNVLEQAQFSHPGILSVTKRAFELMGLEVDVEQLVTHSQNTAFCNYIIAKPSFWRRWLQCNEALYEMAENPEHELYGALNGHADYGGHVQKVFIMERMASILFATEPWRVLCYDTFALHGLSPVFDPFRHHLVACDALKQVFARTQHPSYLEAYLFQRGCVVDQAPCALPRGMIETI